MCYMSSVRSAKPRPASRATAPRARRAPVAPIATVGVRELRQNLSIYLDQVKRGGVLQVTEHGRIVAMLQPAAASETRLDRLEAQGLVTRARTAIRDLSPRPMPPGAPAIATILDDLGADRL